MIKMIFRPGFLAQVKALHKIATDEAMADSLGVSRQTYYDLREGRTSPSTPVLTKAFMHWGYDAGTMLVFEEDTTTSNESEKNAA